jgi:hypothetical protein
VLSPCLAKVDSPCPYRFRPPLDNALQVGSHSYQSQASRIAGNRSITPRTLQRVLPTKSLRLADAIKLREPYKLDLRQAWMH